MLRGGIVIKMHHVSDEAMEAGEWLWIRRKLTAEANWGTEGGVSGTQLSLFCDGVSPTSANGGAPMIIPVISPHSLSHPKN